MKQQDFTQQELEIILHGLGELPLKISGPVFTKVQHALFAMSNQAQPEQDRGAQIVDRDNAD